MLDYEITAAETAELLREKKIRLIDVREPWELATASIPGFEQVQSLRGGIDAWSREVDSKIPRY